ncbi:exported hypothetical protein [Xanthomonas citri pv. citri]|nr:exported hypothetical protein [Xanthomonas citri pv. citri]CEH93918.1 exported hypothetical protein [Xanthomonas citri pv. citri]
MTPTSGGATARSGASFLPHAISPTEKVTSTAMRAGEGVLLFLIIEDMHFSGWHGPPNLCLHRTLSGKADS